MGNVKTALLAAFGMVAGGLAADRGEAAGMVWETYPGFFSPGHAGIVLGDFDGDGRIEAAVSGHAGMQVIATLAKPAAGGALSIESMTVLPGLTLAGRLQRGPGEGGEERLVGVATASGLPSSVVVFGGVPLRVLRTIPVPNITMVSAIADVDADGAPEIVGLQGYQWGAQYPVILDYATGAVKWTGVEAANDVAVAQLDGDAALELLVSTGSSSSSNPAPGRVLDGATRQVEWSWPAGFNRFLVGQFTADPGVRTFATWSQWGGRIQIFRSQPYSPIGEIDAGEVAAASVVRLNGVDHIAIGAGQWGNVSIVNPRTGATTFSVQNPEHGVSAIESGDLDGDGRMELVFGAGLTSTGKDTLRVMDIETQSIDFVSDDEVGPHTAVARGVLSGPGSDQVVFLTMESDSGYRGSNLYVLDALSGARLRSRVEVVDSWTRRVPHVAVAQLDNDPQAEIVVASAQVYTPLVAVIDGVTLQDQWRRQDFAGGSSNVEISAMQTVDVNGDGVDDVVVALNSGRVTVLDGRNGATIWQSVTIQGETAPALAAFRSAGRAYIAMARGRAIYLFDTVSGLVVAVSKRPQSVRTITRWGEGAACRLGALEGDTTFGIFSCSDLSRERELSVPAGSTFARPFDASATRFLVASDGVLYEVRSGRAPARLTPALGTSLGFGDKGIVTPSPDGRSANVIIGTSHMVTRRSVTTDDLFSHGFD